MALNNTLTQEQELVQRQQQLLTAQQILQVKLLEMPLTQLEEKVKEELIVNPALEKDMPEDAESDVRTAEGDVNGRGSCFHGILQYVRHDMGDEAFVGVEEKVGERDVLVYIRCFGIFLAYRHHSFKEGFDVEEFGLWLGDERHSAVLIYKVE